MPLTDTLLRTAVAASSTVLPISESAHRSLATMWLGVSAHAEALRTTVALGTAVGLLVALRERAGPCARVLVDTLRRGVAAVRSDGGRDLAVVGIAALVSIALELALSGRALTLEQEPLVVGVGLVATSIILLSTIAAPAPRRLRPGPLGALLVGLAHGLGVVPGASQVGGAFVALCWLGIRGWRAAELALLVSVPTLLVGAARHLPTLASLPGWDLGLGFGGSALAAALGALGWRALTDREQTRLLVAWLAPLALGMLGYAHAVGR